MRITAVVEQLTTLSELLSENQQMPVYGLSTYNTHMQGHTRYIAPPNWPMPGYEHLALKLPTSIAVPQAATPNGHASNGRSSNGHANKRTRR